MTKNKLIIFEGIDGSGKTTQAKYFAKKLNAVYLREPMFFRKQILSNITPLTELFLFLADRAEVYSKVKQFLKNKHVILDRSFPSTLAYQLEGRGLKKLISFDDYLKIDSLVRQNIKPDLVIVFDVSVKTAVKRLKRKTKFENQRFLIKVRKAYLNLARKYGWTIIKAEKSIEEVRKEVEKIINFVV